VLNVPLVEHVCVAVQPCGGARLSVGRVRPNGVDGRAPIELSLAELYRARDAADDSAERKRLADATSCPVVRCVVGTLVELLAAGLLPNLGEGLNVSLGSTLDELTEAGRDAALAAAVATAAASAFGTLPDWPRIALVCQRVENFWLHRPVGMADALTSLIAESDGIIPFRSDSASLDPIVALPPNIVLLGVDCGVLAPDADEKYARVRTATFMGRLLVDRIMRHEGLLGTRWDGHLAHVTIADYVDRVRDRIPTKIKGADFLSRFGESGDALTRIDPTGIYKVRSRTEHHIYEQIRTREFVDTLARAAQKDETALPEAGEAMYASHWSYGQRCGLGSVETDALVSALRQLGTSQGIVGAKITGRGCGGTLAVLMRGGDQSRQALNNVLRSYRSRTGHVARVLENSSPGAMKFGVRRF